MRIEEVDTIKMKLVLAVITIFIQINVNLSAKCEFRSDTQQLLCRNIDSMNEVANELRPEYVNVAVHNDPSKELYISRNYFKFYILFINI